MIDTGRIQKIKGILILTGSRELNLAFLRFISYVFNIKRENIYYFTFQDSDLISYDVVSDTDLWIIEGFDPENPQNPVGWRTAKKCGKKVFVFFLKRFTVSDQQRTMKAGQETGEAEPIKKHFISFDLNNLKEKLKEVIEKEKPDIRDFEEVEDIWEELKYEPKHHHH